MDAWKKPHTQAAYTNRLSNLQDNSKVIMENQPQPESKPKARPESPFAQAIKNWDHTNILCVNGILCMQK